MSKQKVRPMVDKELRDEVINYCGGGESFNSALRHYAKGKSRAEHFANIYSSKVRVQEETINGLRRQVKRMLKQNAAAIESELMFTRLELQASKSHSMNIAAKNQEIKNQLKRDCEELHRLNKINFELSTKLDGTDKAYKALFELYMDKRGSRLTYLRWGIIFGLVAGLVIGYLFL